MGIDIASWRICIGTFIHFKPFSSFKTVQVKSSSSILNSNTCLLLLCVLSISVCLTVYMDIEPNPGPDSFTSQRRSPTFPYTNAFNKAKRTVLKLTRHKHHLINFVTFKQHHIIPYSLIPRPPPFDTNNEYFYRRWNNITKFSTQRYLKLMIKECKTKIHDLTVDYNNKLDFLRHSCDQDAFIFYNTKLNSMASSLETVLSNRRQSKNSFLRRRKGNYIEQGKNNSIASNSNSNPYIFNIFDLHNPATPSTYKKRNRGRRKSKPFRFVPDNDSVINLSVTPLSTDELSVLARGLTFCPTPRHINRTEISADLYDFSRRMRLTEYFYDSSQNNNTNSNDSQVSTTPRFRNKSTWAPPTDRDQALNTFLDAVKLDISSLTPRRLLDNLTPTERRALSNLKQRRDIVIKPADKGSGTVVMDRTWYINECNRQLNDDKFYKLLHDEDKTTDIQLRVTLYVKSMHKDKYIDDKTKQYLIQSDPKPGRFYILPKIHKPGNPGRPIVSSNGHPTERISEFVDFYLQPLVSTLDSHIKDTNDFLHKLSLIRDLPNNCLLVTLDVSSLYTNIPHNDGINACDYYLSRRSDKTIPTSTLCDLIRMILTMNNFSFNEKHYLQVHGTAMGTKMAPSFANLFLGLFETNALNNAPFQPHTWFRYIDDIFMIWTHGLDNLKIFTDYLNNIHPTIKFTSSHSFDNVPFLDVNVSLSNGVIVTDLYCKPTDKHQHLLFSSSHPIHTKKAIPFSLALRLRRICSTDESFQTRTSELISYLLKRGYNHKFLNEQIQRAADIPRHIALQTKPKKNSNRIPLIVTYNPSLPSISSIFNKHLSLLHSSDRCKTVFPHSPIVAFRRSPNLRDLLVKARLPPPPTDNIPAATNLSPLPGAFRCGKDCLTCRYIAHGTNQYTFSSTGITRSIKTHMTCDTKNVIYMIQCTLCNKQYIGETKRRLKDRFNEHRRPVDKTNIKSAPTTVSDHFLNSANHTASNILLIPIEQICSSRDAIRKAKEAHYINVANTLEPNGLNKRDETF